MGAPLLQHDDRRRRLVARLVTRQAVAERDLLHLGADCGCDGPAAAAVAVAGGPCTHGNVFVGDWDCVVSAATRGAGAAKQR